MGGGGTVTVAALARSAQSSEFEHQASPRPLDSFEPHSLAHTKAVRISKPWCVAASIRAPSRGSPVAGGRRPPGHATPPPPLRSSSSRARRQPRLSSRPPSSWGACTSFASGATASASALSRWCVAHRVTQRCAPPRHASPRLTAPRKGGTNTAPHAHHSRRTWTRRRCSARIPRPTTIACRGACRTGWGTARQPSARLNASPRPRSATGRRSPSRHKT